MGEMTEFLKQGEKILRKSRTLLGEDDPIYDKFKTAMTFYGNAYSSIEGFVKKGKIIEEF